MWTWMIIILDGDAFSTLQTAYLLNIGMRGEAWGFISWMAFALVVGPLFIGGFRVPVPPSRLFPVGNKK